MSKTDGQRTNKVTYCPNNKKQIWKQGTGERVRNQKGVNKQRTTKKIMTKRKVDDDKKLL